MRFVKGNKIIEIQEGPPGYFYLVKKVSVVHGGAERVERAEDVREERKILLPDGAKNSVLEKLKLRGYKSENVGGAVRAKSSGKSSNVVSPPRQMFKKGNDKIEIIFTPPDKYLVRTTLRLTSKSIEDVYAKIKSEKWAVEKSKDEPVQKYLDKSLMAAINDKDVKSVVSLLENGANPNFAVIKDKKRILTPLHQAVRILSPEITAALLNMGADPNATAGEMATTPIMNAVWFADKKNVKKSVEIAKLLIDRGADISIKNAKGHSTSDAIRRKEAVDKIKDFAKLVK